MFTCFKKVFTRFCCMLKGSARSFSVLPTWNNSDEAVSAFLPASKAELRATNFRLEAEITEVRAELAKENSSILALIDKVNPLTPVSQAAS